jgi:hypothetical protein
VRPRSLVVLRARERERERTSATATATAWITAPSRRGRSVREANRVGAGTLTLTLTLTLVGGCGTFGSYEVPESARRAQAMDRTLDRWLAGVELGAEPGGSAAVAPAIACSTDAPVDVNAPRLGDGFEVGRGFVTGGAPWRHGVELDPAEGFGMIRVRVTLPTSMVALQGVAAIAQMERGDPVVSASRATAAAAAVRYLARAGRLDDEGRAWLGGWACESVSDLIVTQRPDGGWGGGGVEAESDQDQGRSDPATTAFALEAMAELRELGVDVPARLLSAPSDAIAAAVGDDGLAAPGAIEAGELSAREVDAARLGVGALAFAALEALPPAALGERAREALPRLEARFAEVAREPGPDVPTLAWAVVGLERAREPRPIERADLWRAARRLWQRRHELRDWAPRWARAYGGAEEITERSLDALRALDPEWLDAARSEALAGLIWDREPTGRWSDARSTAAAVRALLLVGPGHAGARGPVTVIATVGGRELRRVDVDLGDPLAAARAFMAIDLGPITTPLRGELEVRLEGAPGVTGLVVAVLVPPRP